ncbi:MAG: hypothetical protein HZC24_11245 [Rhodocyclales bacterium]|nr:hypothetical protein [Rhodocyclales bacterium]
MTIVAAVIAAILAVVVLVLGGVLPFGRRADAAAAAALKELLLARAAGSVGAEEFARREADLHQALLATAADEKRARRRHLRWAVPALVAALAVALYGLLGAPADSPPEPPPLSRFRPNLPDDVQPPANAGGDLQVMSKRLAEKMAKDPANGEGWLLLARTYGELRQHREAAAAYAKAAELQKLDAATLADWADAHVMAHERRWDDAARRIVQQALAADPKHAKALALAGSAAFERADYKGAIEYWKRMKAAAAPDSMDAKLAAANIDEATALMSGKRPAAPAAAEAATAGIAGTVTLDPALKDKVAPGDTVFVVARAPEGGGPPLAVKRFTAAAFPLAFRLDDGDAMMPGRTLSAAGAALVSARVSKSGNALPQPGDIASAAVKVKPGADGVTLTLRAAR